MATAATRVVANVGCGNVGSGHALPAHFDGWKEVRVDVDVAVRPDIVASLTNLRPLGNGTVHAIWAAHCIEHLFEHEVEQALREFHRVLSDDGIACIIVPDVQSIARYVIEDRMHETVYTSSAGPITAHDMLYGHGAAIARGQHLMAHRCAFTPTVLLNRLRAGAFGDLILLRRPNLELAAVASKRPFRDERERDALVKGLGL